MQFLSSGVQMYNLPSSKPKQIRSIYVDNTLSAAALRNKKKLLKEESKKHINSIRNIWCFLLRQPMPSGI